MARKFKFAVEEYYHVYNRGVDKRIIFLNNGDKIRFQRLLYLCNSDKIVHTSELPEIFLGDNLFELDRGRTLVDIGAYCLMDNHYHLLLREHSENGISHFMQKLVTAYTMYFNLLYDRSGVLFQGKFKAVHVQSDTHLKYLFAYIHLNSLDMFKERSMEKIQTYQFSSLPEHLGNSRPLAKILALRKFPKYFSGALEIKKDLNEWIDLWKNSNFKVRP